jgi:hypothetical protein
LRKIINSFAKKRIASIIKEADLLKSTAQQSSASALNAVLKEVHDLG